MPIKYKSGYKYQTTEEVRVFVGINVKEEINTKFLTLIPEGWLVIRAGYAWDGPSGPTIDTKSFMRGSLVHDALYQLLRQGYLSEHLRDLADVLLQQICLEDGMWRWRAWYVYKSLKWFGHAAADPENVKVIHTAP